MSRLACFLIRVYQLCLSPLLGCRCRFAPSCSHYAEEAIHTHGFAQGSLLAAKRLLKCHPWGSHGFDPVPEQKHGAQQLAPLRRATHAALERNI